MLLAGDLLPVHILVPVNKDAGEVRLWLGRVLWYSAYCSVSETLRART